MIEMECAADVDNNIFMWAVSRDERYKKSPEQLDASLFLFYRQEAVVVMFDDLMYGLSPYVWAGLHHCDGLSLKLYLLFVSPNRVNSRPADFLCLTFQQFTSLGFGQFYEFLQ